MTMYDARRIGYHRQRDGGIAQVTTIAPQKGVAGIDSDGDANLWDSVDGECLNQMAGENYDLVEYLGTTIRAEACAKKTVRMAPVLYKDKMSYWIGDRVYTNEGIAREFDSGIFVRWLIDTPYAIEIEVEE